MVHECSMAAMMAVLERELHNFDSEETDPADSEVAIAGELRELNASYAAQHQDDAEEEVPSAEVRDAEQKIEQQSTVKGGTNDDAAERDDRATQLRAVAVRERPVVVPTEATVHVAGATAVKEAGRDREGGQAEEQKVEPPKDAGCRRTADDISRGTTVVTAKPAATATRGANVESTDTEDTRRGVARRSDRQPVEDAAALAPREARDEKDDPRDGGKAGDSVVSGEIVTGGRVSEVVAHETDAGGAGRGDGRDDADSAEQEDPDERGRRLSVEHAAAWPRFERQVDRARGIYQSGDYEGHPDFVAHGGSSFATDEYTSSVFRVTDPADGGDCVVGFMRASDQETAERNGERYEALLRGAQIDEPQRQNVEQAVARNPADNLPVRAFMPGTRIADLSTADKRHVTAAELRGAADTIAAMIRGRIAPDTAYRRNTFVDVDNARLCFIDYATRELTRDAEGSSDLANAQALLGIAEELGVPRLDEQRDMRAWFEGARVFRTATEVLQERFPGIVREKGHLRELDAEPSDTDSLRPESLPLANGFPFYQDSFYRLIPTLRAGEVDDGLYAAAVFTRFLDAADRIADFQPAGFPNMRQAVVATRDGGEAVLTIREDDEGLTTIREIELHRPDGRATWYTLNAGEQIVVRVEETPDSQVTRGQEVSIQEIAGLIDYLDPEVVDTTVELTNILYTNYNGLLQAPGRYHETQALDVDRLQGHTQLGVFGGFDAVGQLTMSVVDLTGFGGIPTNENMPSVVGRFTTESQPQADVALNLPGFAQRVNLVGDWLQDRGLSLVSSQVGFPWQHGMIAMRIQTGTGESQIAEVSPPEDEGLKRQPDPYQIAQLPREVAALNETARARQFINDALSIRDRDGNVIARATLIDTCTLHVADKPTREEQQAADAAGRSINAGDRGREIEAFNARMNLRIDAEDAEREAGGDPPNWTAANLVLRELTGNWLEHVDGDRHIVVFEWPGTNQICFTYFGFGNVRDESVADIREFLDRPEQGLAQALHVGTVTEADEAEAAASGEDAHGRRGRGFPLMQGLTDFRDVYVDTNGVYAICGSIRPQYATHEQIQREDEMAAATRAAVRGAAESNTEEADLDRILGELGALDEYAAWGDDDTDGDENSDE